MKISELIILLEKVKVRRGDLYVKMQKDALAEFLVDHVNYKVIETEDPGECEEWIEIV